MKYTQTVIDVKNKLDKLGIVVARNTIKVRLKKRFLENKDYKLHYDNIMKTSLILLTDECAEKIIGFYTIRG